MSHAIRMATHRGAMSGVLPKADTAGGFQICAQSLLQVRGQVCEDVLPHETTVQCAAAASGPAPSADIVPSNVAAMRIRLVEELEGAVAKLGLTPDLAATELVWPPDECAGDTVAGLQWRNNSCPVDSSIMCLLAVVHWNDGHLLRPMWGQVQRLLSLPSTDGAFDLPPEHLTALWVVCLARATQLKKHGIAHRLGYAALLSLATTETERQMYEVGKLFQHDELQTRVLAGLPGAAPWAAKHRTVLRVSQKCTVCSPGVVTAVWHEAELRETTLLPMDVSPTAAVPPTLTPEQLLQTTLEHTLARVHRSEQRCPTCQRLFLVRTTEAIHLPEVLQVPVPRDLRTPSTSAVVLQGDLDRRCSVGITWMDRVVPGSAADYALVAVAFGNDRHYSCWVRVHHRWWKHDGLRHQGQMVPLKHKHVRQVQTTEACQLYFARL
jgi:hypothetical protein